MVPLFMKITGLGKIPVIILRDNFVITQTPNGLVVTERPLAKPDNS